MSGTVGRLVEEVESFLGGIPCHGGEMADLWGGGRSLLGAAVLEGAPVGDHGDRGVDLRFRRDASKQGTLGGGAVALGEVKGGDGFVFLEDRGKGGGGDQAAAWDDAERCVGASRGGKIEGEDPRFCSKKLMEQEDALGGCLGSEREQ